MAWKWIRLRLEHHRVASAGGGGQGAASLVTDCFAGLRSPFICDQHLELGSPFNRGEPRRSHGVARRKGGTWNFGHLENRNKT